MTLARPAVLLVDPNLTSVCRRFRSDNIDDHQKTRAVALELLGMGRWQRPFSRRLLDWRFGGIIHARFEAAEIFFRSHNVRCVRCKSSRQPESVAVAGILQTDCHILRSSICAAITGWQLGHPLASWQVAGGSAPVLWCGMRIALTAALKEAFFRCAAHLC